MIVNKSKLKTHIEHNIHKHNLELSLRLNFLLEEIKNIESDEKGNIELFELLLQIVFIADQGPAQIISNLLIPINSECSYLLDQGTISEAASFIRDFLKKDFIIDNLHN